MREKLANQLGALLLANIEQQSALEQGAAGVEKTYTMLAEIIRSEQMSHAEAVDKLQSDPAFAAWYRAKYGLRNGETK